MGFIIIKVSVPDLTFTKTLKINDKEYIYKLKEDLIKKCGKKEFLLNYGILLYNTQDLPGIYLNEGKTLAYYSIDEKSKMEFVLKKRLNIEEPESNPNLVNTMSSKDKKKFVEEIQKKLMDKLSERLSKNLDPNFCTETGETPLTIAIQNNDMDIFKLLIRYGAHVDFRMNAKFNWMTPLHYAITIRNREMMTALIQEGACVDSLDTRGYSPLFLAVINDENEYIKLLAIASTRYNTVDKDGNGLLHHACMNNNIHALSILIDCGVDMNSSNKEGNTPLHLSVLTENKEMVKKLITRGCNRELINNDGKTAKGIAGLKGLTEIFDLLNNFSSTQIEPPPPPIENKQKMVNELLDDTQTKLNAATFLRKGTMKPDALMLLRKISSLTSSQTRLNQTRRKKRLPPPPPLPVFDLKELDLEELNNNPPTSNSGNQEDGDNKAASNNVLNENMLNKQNFDMMVNILYDMVRIVNFEEKNVRSVEDYQNRIEGRLARQKEEFSNYLLLKKTEEEKMKENSVESENKVC